MADGALTQLPGIHATLVGIIAAVFLSFAAYAYDKLLDAKERLDAELKKLADMCTASSSIASGMNIEKIFNPDGGLIWDKALLMGGAHIYFSNLDTARLYPSFQFHEGREMPPDSHLEEGCLFLCQYLHAILSSYPFNGSRFTTGVGRDAAFTPDAQWASDLSSRAGFLSWFAEVNRSALFELANSATRISHAKELEYIKKRMEKKHYQDLPEDQRNAEWERRRSEIRPIEYAAILSELLNRIEQISKHHAPIIQEAIQVRDKYQKQYPLKTYTYIATGVMGYILTLGVIAPLFMITATSEWSPEWHYSILMLSMVPYIIGILSAAYISLTSKL